MKRSNAKSTNKPAKRIRSYYTPEEDFQIRQYVKNQLEVHGQISLSGETFWKRMEGKKVLPINRSWMSLRDRYLKHIKGKSSPKKHAIIEIGDIVDVIDDNYDNKDGVDDKDGSDDDQDGDGDKDGVDDGKDDGNDDKDGVDDKGDGDDDKGGVDDKGGIDCGYDGAHDGKDGVDGDQDGIDDSSSDEMSQFDKQLMRQVEEENAGDDVDNKRDTKSTSGSDIEVDQSQFSIEVVEVLRMVYIMRCRTCATLPEIFSSIYQTKASLEDAIALINNIDKDV